MRLVQAAILGQSWSMLLLRSRRAVSAEKRGRADRRSIPPITKFSCWGGTHPRTPNTWRRCSGRPIFPSSISSAISASSRFPCVRDFSDEFRDADLRSSITRSRPGRSMAPTSHPVDAPAPNATSTRSTRRSRLDRVRGGHGAGQAFLRLCDPGRLPGDNPFRQ